MLRDRWPFGRKTRSFTLQWHLTNACDGNCRHCYDRSELGEPAFEQAMRILDDFRGFCRKRRVAPHVCLSGGDPFRYSHFWELYREIDAANLHVSLLANPIEPAEIDRLVAIRPPVYYQVSLEGLREHNDQMRGQGHFDRTLAFLDAARDRRLTTHVMLTLTRDNFDQVIPLGDLLRFHTLRFTFNRLSAVGQGADLALPSREEFVDFLQQYQRAAMANPVFGFKDNLFNILRHRHGQKLLPGCTGFGCGAAFNFVALLPNGEVHACRKFPSPLGNAFEQALGEIYDSTAAKAYRAGSAACRGCPIKSKCGGCLAVAFGQGRTPLTDRDPHCFIASNGSHS